MQHTNKANNNHANRGKGIFAFVFITLAVLCFLVSGLLTYSYAQRQETLQMMQETVSASGFFAGTQVEGIDLSGLEYDQAKALVEAKLAQEDSQRVVRVVAGGQEYSQSIAATHNLDEVLVNAFNVGREGTLEERYAVVTNLAVNGSESFVDTQLESAGLEAFILRIERGAYTPAKDATVAVFDPADRSFVFTDEQNGEKLNTEDLRQQIDALLEADDFSAPIQAVMESLFPNITRQELESQNKLLGTFTTKTTSDKDRNTNIRLCSSAFNGYVLMPGETFSINALTGPRTPAKGYKDAGAIRGGVLVPEPGGGVCQVSTTLFNAVVRAGMEIVTRYCHSWPSTYVDIGMDAAIDYPAKDFKFKNTSDAPIYLVSHFEDRMLTIEVYGKPVLEEGVTIELRSTTDEVVPRADDGYEFDASLAPGETVKIRDGRDGKNSTTYIQYWKDGQKIEEKVLFKSVYPPIRAKYAYGPELTTDWGVPTDWE